MVENLGAGPGVLKINKPLFDKNTDAGSVGAGTSAKDISILGNRQIGGITSKEAQKEASAKVVLTDDEKKALFEEKRGFAGLGRERIMSEEAIKKAGTPVEQNADTEAERLAAAKRALENRGR